MITKRVLIVFFILFLFIQVASAADVKIGGTDKIQFFGDLIVEADETIRGDVVVMKGNLIVRGVVNGNAVVYFGDAVVDSTGAINGDLVTLRGKITVCEKGVVTGNIVESRLFDISLDDKIKEDDFYEEEEEYEEDFYDRAENIDSDRSSKKRHKKFKKDHEPDIDVRLSYNKVDGFFLGLAFPKRVRADLIPKVTLQGFTGYGFANKRWQYHAELDKWFFKENRLEFGIEGHDLTDTEDGWIIDNEENSLAAFFLNEDFRDYYYRRGFGAHISQEFGKILRLKVKYLADDYQATENNAVWSLFKGSDPPFTPNFGFLPGDNNINEGLMRSVTASGEIRLFDNDLKVNGSVEAAGYDLGGDFEFTRAIFEGRGFFKLDKFQGIDYRLRLGNTIDESGSGLPYQKYFTLGGISSLRAHKFKELYGEQMALLNLEYRLFHGKGSSFFWVQEIFQVGLFADIGSCQRGIFNKFDWEDYETDVGFALMNEDGNIRLNVARRTDTAKEPWVVTFRIKHPF
ncbi:hypothetical protein ISS30_06270 [bacterium]|nr:hypothetical protein [FCB group bacterium]MBL7191284.1 hypothetical protein [bacterium]